MSKFLNDLNTGQEYEKKVIKAFKKTFGITLNKNSNSREVDLLHELFSMEVKCDRQMDGTGNLFIEMSCSGKYSGIFKEEEYEYFAYGNDEMVMVFSRSLLQEKIIEGIITGEFQVKKGGDGFRSVGCLIPQIKILPIAKCVIYF